MIIRTFLAVMFIQKTSESPLGIKKTTLRHWSHSIFGFSYFTHQGCTAIAFLITGATSLQKPRKKKRGVYQHVNNKEKKALYVKVMKKAMERKVYLCKKKKKGGKR